jgi:hypothetical protein
MAEILSREATRVASPANGGKLRAASSGYCSASVITGPDVVTWANGDVCGNRDIIPAGARILGAFVSNAAMGASVTLDVGLRASTNDGSIGAAIDADGIVAALAVSSASSVFAGTGAFVAAGAEYVTAVPSEPYFTLAGGTPTANADIRVTVVYVAA